MRWQRFAHHYLGFVGGLWFTAFLLGAPRVVAAGGLDMVAAGGLAVMGGFGVACCVAATDRAGARLEVLALAGALPLWLSVRICLGLVLPGEWESVLLPVAPLAALALGLIVAPFGLVAASLRTQPARG